ncbi:MAG: Cell division protein FtsH [Firmicutes bacterium]|nr:Cell division protein FtsH [Bacillota bacterium]MDI6707229.1 ATP-dependent zinc metalloprotease FtsH [Bacillota bacterium]
MSKFFRGASFYILIFIIIVAIVQMYGASSKEITKLEYSQLIIQINDQNVSKLIIEDKVVTGVLKDGTEFQSTVPDLQTFNQYILPQIKEGILQVNYKIPPGTPWWAQMLPTLFVILLFVVLWFFFMQQSQGGGNRVMSFGKSKAKLHSEDKRRISFDDVAGAKEEKEELSEIVEFLKNPRKFIELGARIPKGVLLVGPPGTGKTYLARAVSGEAGVPFFSISGSDFVEMFVGVGASRVRDLFEQAKKNSPCIVFIDEIDAVGRHRGAGLGGGHDEREQTLNQLLVEMDGFSVNEGIIIIAATNRPDILDPALLRPGRFDRQVLVGVPDVKEREAVLKIHSRGKPLEEEINLEDIAKGTPGFTPADLENLMNEAALLAARKGKKKIGREELEEGVTRVIAGPEKRSRVMSEKDKKLTAYHEAGHAVVARLLPNSDPVHQISIVPRGRAGGYTMILPKEDKYYMSKSEMEEYLVHLLGGRVAEKLALNDISTGAQNDLEKVTRMARKMVTEYGMSENLGPMTFGTGHDEVFIGKEMARSKNYSEEVAAEIDKEVKNIIDKAYASALEILEKNIQKLHTVASALLEREKLTGEEFEEIFAQA